MRSFIFTFGVMIAFCLILSGMDTPIVSGSANAPATNATQYSQIQGNRMSWNAGEVNRRNIVPIPCTLKNLAVELATAPGGSGQYVFTIMTNGASSAITCTISGANLTANDTVNTATIPAGTAVSIRSTPSNNPLSGGHIRMSLLVSANPNTSLIIGATANNSLATVATNYWGIQGNEGPGTLAQVQALVPTSGTLQNLFVQTDASVGAGANYMFTVYKNGVATSLTNMISGASQIISSNVVDTVSVSAGDFLAFESLPSSGTSPSARFCRWGIQFTPAVDGESVLLFGLNNNPSTSSTTYQYPVGYPVNTSWNTSETLRMAIGQACTYKSFYVTTQVAPGAGKSWTFTLRKNQLDQALTAAISGTSTNASDTVNSFTTSLGDELGMQLNPSGTPANATAIRWGIVQFINPSTSDSDFFEFLH